MKKITAWILVLALLIGLAPAQAESGGDESVSVERVTLPFYISTVEAEDEFTVCLLNGDGDLPWIDATDLPGLLCMLYNDCFPDPDYALDYVMDPEEHLLILTRENGYFMQVDFADDLIVFNDYDLFIHDSTDSALLEKLFAGPDVSNRKGTLFQSTVGKSCERQGDAVVLDLKEYHISLPEAEGTGFLPLQLISDFLVSPVFEQSLFYNGNALFLGDADCFGTREGGLTPLGEYYYSAAPVSRSKALAEFGYNELCLALDCLYGLKEIHGITSFSQLFWQTGLDGQLADADSAAADKALEYLINLCLDDQHSAFLSPSWMSSASCAVESTGPSTEKYNADKDMYTECREKYLGENFDSYQEIGNTAYITFDAFTSMDWPSYYEEPVPDGEDGEPDEDTVQLIHRAHEMIYRKDSPVENVVIDLSCNEGGSVPAAAFVMCWVLGDASVSMENKFTGANSNTFYRADVNLDGAFTVEDTLYDKKVFCLISPLSFSCGNLVPAAFKNTQKATLIGRTSGGGSCLVLPFSTAWGTLIQLSGNYQMSYFKNGVFYDIDRGIEPDLYLANLDSYYNREQLTAYINGLI